MGSALGVGIIRTPLEPVHAEQMSCQDGGTVILERRPELALEVSTGRFVQLRLHPAMMILPPVIHEAQLRRDQPIPPSTITQRSFGKRCGTAEVISGARLRCIMNIFLSQTDKTAESSRFAYSGSAIGVLLWGSTGSPSQRRSRSLTGRQPVAKRDGSTGLPMLRTAA
jgi:hypothetical protein